MTKYDKLRNLTNLNEENQTNLQLKYKYCKLHIRISCHKINNNV